MNLEEIAEAERTDVQQLFVRAVRLFGKQSNSATGDFNRWKENPDILPRYVAEYAAYWTRFNRTETRRSHA